MKFAPYIFAVSFLSGIAHAGDRDMPRAPGYPGQGAFEPPSATGYPAPGGLRIERRADEQGYYLLIHTGGLAPHAVQVTPMGHSLVISKTQSLQSEHRQAPQEIHPGYRRWSYSTYRSSGAMQRRISVPRDANIEAMQRTDREATILITLPRVPQAAPRGRYD